MKIKSYLPFSGHIDTIAVHFGIKRKDLNLKKNSILAVFLGILLASYCIADSSLVVNTYPLKWARASELLDTVNSLIGDTGKAYTYTAGNELIVSTTEELHTQLAKLLQEIDRPTPNVQLDVVFNETSTSIDRGAVIKGSRKVVVTGKGSTKHYKFNAEARNRTTNLSSNTKQILLIQSGREGQLHIGEEIPYAEWLFYYGRSHGHIDHDFQFDIKRTGVILTASPKVIGNGPMVSITLTPEIRTLVGKKFKRFRLTSAATTVTAYDGQTISIAGTTQNNEFYDKFLVGFSANGEIKSLNITLTPYIKYPGVQ